MKNNARIGGILSIVAGAIGVLWLLMFIFMILVLTIMPWDRFYHYYYDYEREIFTSMAIFYTIIAVIFTLLGVLAIIGGALAVKKRHWGWALAGSIAGTLVFLPCGIPAIIFTALGKPEFDIPNQLPMKAADT
jgi:quinol-cytochrome oxidoreductase complex cytochrome b subunit